MKRLTFTAVCLLGCVLAPGCQAIVGIGERSEAPLVEDAGGGGDGPPTLDPDAAPPAGCPDGCLPPAPAGWTGPSATYDGLPGGLPTDCPAPYTVKQLDAHVGMTVPPATCDCGPPTITGRRCNADVTTYANGSCTLGITFVGTATSAGSCLTTVGTNPGYAVLTPTLTAGTCTYPSLSTTLPPPVFGTVQSACGLPQAMACGDRADCTTTPVPGAPYTRVCIFKDGDVSCPSGDYAQRFVAHKAFDEKRACSACSATPTGGTCGTQWGESGNQLQCASQAPFDKMVGTCYPHTAGKLVNIGAMGPSPGTCTPTGGAPTGTATSIDPVTFCCNR
jgi:hypothetical protein